MLLFTGVLEHVHCLPDRAHAQVYGPGIHPAFPEGGKMSQHLDTLQVGDEIHVKGPIGHFVYEGKGNYILHGKTRGVARHLSMLAGGTGEGGALS
jgi:nitrate reductase (NAD(P)H)